MKRVGKGVNDRGRGGSSYRGKGRNNLRNFSGSKSRQNFTEEGNYNSNSGRDRSKVKCYNYSRYEHYATECRKPKREKDSRRDKEKKQKANLTQTTDDEPSLLLAECDTIDRAVFLLNEEGVIPKLNSGSECDSLKRVVPRQRGQQPYDRN